MPAVLLNPKLVEGYTSVEDFATRLGLSVMYTKKLAKRHGWPRARVNVNGPPIFPNEFVTVMVARVMMLTRDAYKISAPNDIVEIF